MLINKPRGTNDILPGTIEKWQALEKEVRYVSYLYGYEEIRTPIFEHTELFIRSVGETTDIVEKEMYTFLDRGERSITLRPEGTAPTVRAFVENKMFADILPRKLYYLGPMFRYDRPQAGRYRQFHQFGVEVFGTVDPGIDAEVILMAMDVLSRLGLKNLRVELNSVGCADCRPKYLEKIRNLLLPQKERLCKTCQDRYVKNPLRILDCKSKDCQEIIGGIPSIVDDLCPTCREHFNMLRIYLDKLNISYRLDPKLVRGLDYYTMTAFEIVAEGIGAQSSICGGGRYDGLIEQCGGPPLPGIGYAMGVERILAAMELQGVTVDQRERCDLYIATMGEQAQIEGARILYRMRMNGIAAEKDYLGRSLKAQMKNAARLNAPYVLILGDKELQDNVVMLRKMACSEQYEISVDKLEETLFSMIREDKNSE